MESISFEKLTEIFLPVIVFLITVIAGWIFRKIIFVKLNRWAEKTQTQVDDIIIGTIKTPIIIWVLIAAFYFALEVSKLPNNLVIVLHRILIALVIFSVTVVMANIVSALIKVYSAKVETAIPVTSLTQNISKIVIFSVGILVILNSFGISITPILTALGVGGLAVALALQDTLSNLFAGFYISVARQIKAGDYVKLESGEEGYVTDITWRTTTIKMLPNNMVLIPNEKLTKSVVVNYSLPERKMALGINVGVHYNSDLEKVERITVEVAKEVIREVPGTVKDFEPSVRYNTFADSSVNFSIGFMINEFTDQYLVKHEFIKRLHERYRKEGIIIPYPIRAINYEQEAAKK